MNKFRYTQKSSTTGNYPIVDGNSNNDIFDLDVDEDINLYLSKKKVISPCKMLNRCICNMVFVMVHLVFRMVICISGIR